MTTTLSGPLAHNPDNQAPVETDPLKERLEQDHAALIDEAADLEIEAFTLPDKIETDEHAAAITDFIAKLKGLASRAEKIRVDEKEPYLTSGRTVDAFFKELAAPVDERAGKFLALLNAYKQAKAAAERAARLAREAEERQRAEEERAAAEAARRAAEEAQRAADAEAARVRSAADAQEREEAQARMAAQAQEAAVQRQAAEEASAAAAQADRVADQHAKVATGPAGKLGKVTSAGATSSSTTFWNHRIKDADALIASMGPIGRFVSNDAIVTAINAAKREHVQAGTMATLVLPGVEFFEDQRTAVAAKK